MGDNQRETMYNGWASTKKWVDVEINQEGEQWKATAIVNGEEVSEIRKEKHNTISAMHSTLYYMGYEIKNKFELFQ